MNLASCNEESDAKYPLTFELAGIEQDRTVGAPVIVEIGCNELLPEGTVQQAMRFSEF